MKKCPKCNDLVVYEDSDNFCQKCNTLLERYIPAKRPSKPNSTDGNVRTASADYRQVIEPTRRDGGERVLPEIEPVVNPVRGGGNRGRSTTPQFETREGGYYYFRGSVSEIQSNNRLNTRLKKWMNSLFLLQPFELGPTSHETVIRIESFHPGRISGESRNVVFYGDVEGQIHTGDDVQITARRVGGRFVVKRLYLNDTETEVRPGIQIPAWVIILVTALLLLGVAVLVIGLVNFINSGALYGLLGKIAAIAIIAIVIIGIIKSVFKKR